MTINAKEKRHILLTLCVFIMLSFALTCHATSSAPPLPPGGGGGGGEVSGSGAVLPDLFTGTMRYSIPIGVTPGRKGMQPNLALTYRSNSGNGWVGVGWDLEVGAIERRVTGLTYNDTIDTYVLRMAGSTIDLIYDNSPSAGFYRAKIEGGFYKVEKKASYWKVTDKTGRKYLFGQTYASRQDNPADTNKIFKWCLDHVEDTNGNYLDISYEKNPLNGTGPYEGQIYLKQIDYTGNSITGVRPTNYVHFDLESRTDAPDMYTTNFRVRTAYRLKTINVSANGNPVTTYQLSYLPSNSPSTKRSLLSKVQQFGKDGTTVLPAITFPNWQDFGALSGTFPSSADRTITTTYSKDYSVYLGDFNGDGITDIYMFNSNTGESVVGLNDGHGVITWTLQAGVGTGYYAQLGDFDGDGKKDIYLFNPTTGDNIVGVSKGSIIDWLPSLGTRGAGYIAMLGDFNGDGKSDIYMFNTVTGSHIVWSNPTSINQTVWQMDGKGVAHNVLFGDFNGDGVTDIYMYQPGHLQNQSYGDHIVWLNNGNGTFPQDFNWHLSVGPSIVTGSTILLGDFNGDGKTDIYMFRPGDGHHIVWLNQGDGTFPGNYSWQSDSGNYSLSGIDVGGECFGIGPCYTNVTSVQLGDFNGDGKIDIYMSNYAGGGQAVWLNNGDGKFPQGTTPYNWTGIGADKTALLGDFNGDGKADIYIYSASSGVHNMWLNQGLYPDLLSSISNGIGGTTTISYKPSTQYTNTQLPFPVNTVSSVATNDGNVTTNDGNGVSSTTNYTYSGGFFHIGERDFRGFNYIKVTGPVGPNGEQRITETWSHQGNDTAVDVNDPTAHDGYMKGKPYRTRISDGSMNKYSEVTTTYWTDTAPPYFNPPQQVDSYICDGRPCGIHTKTTYFYDIYGNMSIEKYYDDAANSIPYRTVSRNFSSNVTDWLVGLPLSETVSDLTGTQVAKTVLCYDGATNCTVDSFVSQALSKGNQTSIIRWFKEKQNGEYDPVIKMTYDEYGYGTLKSTQDAKGYNTNLSYDSTFIYPTVVTNRLGQQTVTQYYGIDSVAADNGLYGQIKSVTDPNGAKAETQYDTFGRKTHMTMPDGTWQHWDYSPLGTVGSQHVTLSDNNGLSSSMYFDGLGRSFLGQTSGPGGKTIYTETDYNTTGTVKRKSSPNFSAAPSDQLWTTYAYDPIGRTTQVTNPDDKSVFACYSPGVTAGIDADKHQKRETRDSLGRLIKVEEYEKTCQFQGTYETCSITGGTLYATTKYDYDVLGNLVTVTDDSGNITIIHYDSLGRKKDMTDPDMGLWTYQYDSNSNLHIQTDAKNQIITFNYDELNRLKSKHYPTGTDVSYTYDISPDTSIPTFPIGRRSTMSDASGTTKYFYDNMGRSTLTRKTVDGSDYTIKVEYDNGRMASITYPDNETVRYSYGTGNELNTVRNSSDYIYAYYPAADYTALGQPRTLINGNGVNTTYQYYQLNSRLLNITTSYFDKQLLNLTYDYYDGGNIKTITDPDQPAITEPGESVTYKYEATPHFVTSTTDGRTYKPDLNGNMKNMISNGTRTIDYDYDNMPTSVTTNGISTSFVYDGAGTRVKKTDSNGPTIYIGQLYECRADSCTKYIFANGKRIAANFNGDILYYHQDHLGSTRIVTNDTGANQESSYYYLFGAIQSDTGAVSVNHKYTQQEFDAETGLYYYNARYYDPVLGRFISPDTIVPNPSDPQAFNRYSYVMNNPMRYTDPSGHSLHFNDYFSDAERTIRGDVNRAAQNTTNSYLMNFLGDPTLGHYMLGRKESGRNYIAGEMTVATIVAAVASWYCDGCAGYLVGGLNAAALAELKAGYAAHQNDTDPLNAVAVSGAIGFVVGAVSSYAGEEAATWLTNQGYINSSLAYYTAEGAVEGGVKSSLNVAVSNQKGSWGTSIMSGIATGALMGAAKNEFIETGAKDWVTEKTGSILGAAKNHWNQWMGTSMGDNEVYYYSIDTTYGTTMFTAPE